MHTQWYPLTRHLVYAYVRDADVGGNSAIGRFKKAAQLLAPDVASDLSIDGVYYRFADLHTYCVAPKFVLEELHDPGAGSGDDLDNEAYLQVAILCDLPGLVQRFWKQQGDDDMKHDDSKLVYRTLTPWERYRNTAIQVGSIKTFRWLLAQPQADKHIRDEHGRLVSTPIILAARYGKVEIARWLLNDEKYYNGRTPQEIQYIMNEAARNGHIEVLKLLIELVRMDAERPPAFASAASALDPDLTGVMRLPIGVLALMDLLNAAFIKAAGSGACITIETLLDDYFDAQHETLILLRDPRTILASLTSAATRGRTKVVNMLLSLPTVHSLLTLRVHDTPLAIAIHTGNLEIARLLHQKGEMPIPAYLVNVAVCAGQLPALRWLTARRKGVANVTALAFGRAVMRGYGDVVEFVLQEQKSGRMCILEPSEDDELNDEDRYKGHPRIYLGNPLLTAIVNGQDEMDILLRQMGCTDKEIPAGVESLFADRTFPIEEVGVVYVKAFEDRETGTNRQIWARKMPKGMLHVRGRALRIP